MRGIKVVAFDTGGTVLDWHGGLVPGSPSAAHGAALSMIGMGLPMNTGVAH
jgi:hypothetical protein